MSKKYDLGKPIVHIPKNAKLNTDSDQLPPPKTAYDYRKASFDEETMKKATGREYDRKSK